MPLVTVLLATHDDAQYLRAALDSVLAQTLRDIELVVVDDASTDETAELLDAVSDPRLRVIDNDRRAGLAASLNRGLDAAAGRYVARLDADDVAQPERLERQLEALQETGSAVVGSAVRDLDADGRAGRVHRMPVGALAVRWHALFSSPFFHPTVLVEREALDRNGLRYDASFLESEDYDLWTRLLATGVHGGNVRAPLVLKRVHPAQASRRRFDLQRSFQRRVALREIVRVAPDVDAEAAWGFAVGLTRSDAAAGAYRSLLHAFEATHGVDREVRLAAARRLVRGGRLPPLAARRRGAERVAAGAVCVTVVSPEPTPYRAPLFDLVAARDDIALTVVYAASTVARRTWSVPLHHDAIFLRGARVPGARRLLRHDYHVTPGVVRMVRETDPDVVVVSGWSTFAAQAAIAWSRACAIPYVLLVESHDVRARPRWRRVVKEAVVPRLVRGAAAWLAIGSAARDSVARHGADRGRIRIFANTIDVAEWVRRADAARAAHEGFVVLCVARLAPEKGIDTLIRAVAAADVGARVAVAGTGAQRDVLERLAAQLRVDVRFLGDVPHDDLPAVYADADVFALLSSHEPWGVVVNEAAAAGLPLVLSEAVGAAHDLLREGENGFLVPPGDVAAAATALAMLASDRALRTRMGRRSRQLVHAWGYDPSVEAFVASVREAVASR